MNDPLSRPAKKRSSAVTILKRDLRRAVKKAYRLGYAQAEARLDRLIKAIVGHEKLPDLPR